MAHTTPAWPPGSPRVLMTDCWLQNAGDAAIAIASQRMIHAISPSAAVVHAAYGVDAVGERYPELTLVPPLEALLGTRWLAPDPTLAGRDFVAAADVVISQGGGFLREGYEPWGRIDALERASNLVATVGFVGQTIGTFDRAFARAALGTILRRADVVVVRDRASVHNAVDLGADAARVRLGTDVALDLVEIDEVDAPVGRLPASPATGSPTFTPEPPRRGVSLTLTDHEVRGETFDRGYVAARLLSAVLANYPDHRVTLWSSAQGIPVDSEDDVVAHAARDQQPRADRDRVDILEGHLDAYDLYRLATGTTALLSMRFHPALVAAAAGIPSVLAMSDPKAAFFAGTPMMRRVVVGHDDHSARDAAAMADPDTARTTGRHLLGPVLDRLAVVRAAFAELLDRAASADRPAL